MKYKSQRVTKKSLIWMVLALAVVGGATKYFWPASSADTKSSVQTVTTFVVAQRDFPVVLEATGSTVAANIVDIRPQVTNVVAKIHIKEGQMVKAGDLLISLDDRADRANYEKAQATADDAQRQLNRAEELLRQQFVTQGAVDTARANSQAAQAAARAAQAQLSYDNIRSPITGRAGIINVFPGALVQPGNTVSTSTTATATNPQGAMLTITQLDPINVQFTVPESALPALFAAQQKGQAPTITFQMGDGKKREGKVYVIDNQVDQAIGAVKVKAVVDNADQTLIPGQFVRLQVQSGNFKDVLVVPSQAVVTNARGDQVFLVDAENTANLKPIKVQTQSQGFAVITGINAGDKVVVEGKQNLRPNGKVKEAVAKTDGKPEAKPDAKPESKAEAHK
ncbi:efflux RND transporter periplasmic adaptor subunit [Limnohabitans sp.]|uniref:efflux RND transporter periplasmic adaptor subunit n=1 Tax=Limnohabitans sp. TaxID=1907725 RepID=UPI00286F4B9B|nr:efflux RND transporter periplasmic adaptor subunit [Limnohabitans sp.]